MHNHGGIVQRVATKTFETQRNRGSRGFWSCEAGGKIVASREGFER